MGLFSSLFRGPARPAGVAAEAHSAGHDDETDGSAAVAGPGDATPGDWPSTCLVCRAWPRAPLCEDCVAVHAAAATRCPRCAIRVPGAGLLCGACARTPPPMCHSWAAVDYVHPWSGLLNGLKHHGALDVAPALAALMQRQRQGERASMGSAAPPVGDLVIPVPLTAARLRARGHNQAWELARRLASGSGLAADARLLRRVREAPAQQGLDRRARLENLAGAFALAPGAHARLSGRDVLLVDDVMTTGATLREAARVLLSGGAASVQGWVLARTPEA